MTLCKLEDCSARMLSELSDSIRTWLTKQIERNGTKWLILKVILELCCTFVIGHISSEMQHHKNKLYTIMFKKKPNKQTNKQKHLKDNK